ncbi:MAG: hypothetical protein RLZZ338_3149 [Cyanobacteriota bacterium]
MSSPRSEMLVLGTGYANPLQFFCPSGMLAKSLARGVVLGFTLFNSTYSLNYSFFAHLGCFPKVLPEGLFCVQPNLLTKLPRGGDEAITGGLPHLCAIPKTVTKFSDFVVFSRSRFWVSVSCLPDKT